jgi:DNA-binding protein H-NS
MAKQSKHDLNLESLDYGQLCQVRDQVAELIDQKRAEARQQLQQEFMAKAQELGFDPKDVFGGKTGPKAAGKKSGTAQVKYRHPSDPTLTWSGRGRMATWLAELVAKGDNKEKYAV